MNHDQIPTVNSPDLLRKLTSRRSALGVIGKLTASICTVPAILAALSRESFGASLPGEVEDVLRFALTLEHLEADFYKTGMSKSGLIPEEHRKVFEQIASNEAEHVRLLAAATAEPFKGVKYDFTGGGRYPDVFSNYRSFLMVAQIFEDNGVRAYKGQAVKLMQAGLILSIALRIHSVEARHASEVRRIRGQKGWISGSNGGDVPSFARGVYEGEGNTMQGTVNVAAIKGVSPTAATEAFDEPLTKEAVLQNVRPFIYK